VEAVSDLRGALGTLSRRQRTVVVLRYWEGLSEAEVADLLGCSVGTVKSTAFRSLAHLREAMGRADPSPGGVPSDRERTSFSW